MDKNCKRHDAAGNRILPHPEMKLYYKNDPQSLALVSRYMPHKLVCLPDVEIRITVKNPVVALFYQIYPGETKEKEILLTEKHLANLRRLYCYPGKWKVDKSKPDRVIFRRSGRVIMDPLRRYGVWIKRNEGGS